MMRDFYVNLRVDKLKVKVFLIIMFQLKNVRLTILAAIGASLVLAACGKQEVITIQAPTALKPAAPKAAVQPPVQAVAPKVVEEPKEPAVAPTSAKVTREFYLQLASPDSIYVVWRMDGAITPVVRWGTSPDALDHEVSADNIFLRLQAEKSDANTEPLHSAPEGTHQYEVKITGLETDTEYYYAVYDSTRLLSEKGAKGDYRFRTHPEPGKEHPLRFWVVGDSGTGAHPPRKVHTAMLEHVKKDGRPIDLYVHVGDMAYTHGKDDQFTKGFFEIYEDTLRNVPVWASMGNHEGLTSKGETGIGPFYDAYICPKEGEVGGVPSGMEAYYAFDYGRTHFIVLDSHDLDRAPTGVMAKWLQEDLEKVKDADFIVCYFHHPPYTKGSHDSDTESQLIEMRKFILPILESGGVDIVFTGHSHIYERSMLIDGAYATPTVAENVVLDDGDGDPDGDGAYKKSAGIHANEGAVQVVAGHGGQGLSRRGTSPIMKKIIVENGSVICDIDGNTLKAVMINADGEVRDVFSIVKEGSVTPTRIADPWQPEPYKVANNNKKPEKKPKGAAEKGPSEFTTLIAKNKIWNYLTNGHPEANWTGVDFDDSSWSEGQAGFGYGDDDDKTPLSDMKNNYTTVYIRQPFKIENEAQLGKVGLMMRYDDAFIVHINGKEALRVGVGSGSGKEAKDIEAAEAKTGYTYFPLKGAASLLKVGGNIIAIEGHNIRKDSSDFTLDPYLILEK